MGLKLTMKARRSEKTVVCTAGAELYSFMKCFWFMSVYPWIVDGCIR